MTFRERIAELLHQALCADERYIEGIEDKIVEVVTQIEGLRSRIEELFLDEGINFINDSTTLFRRLGEVGGDAISAFPRAPNLDLTLALANSLNPALLDSLTPVNLHGMAISPEPEFEGAYSVSGDSLSLFAYENALRPSDSIMYIDLSPSAPKVDVTNSNPPQMVTAIACVLVGSTPQKLTQGRHTISSTDNATARVSYLKYHLLLQGHLLTNPVASPNVRDLRDIAETLSVTNTYSQFREPFEILSEVNSRRTVLDSFLSCYHTLENYMIRARLVTVESASGGPALFGIRHFKRMGLAVAGKEHEHFTALFKSCWDKSVGGVTLQDFTDKKIKDMAAKPNFSISDFQDFLILTTVLEPGKNVNIHNTQDIRRLVPSLLYQVRCSIVHNKETEYHLSNKELGNETRMTILTDLCIPIMQLLAFGLPSVSNPNPISYSRQALQLY
ncbi:hypothetical protein [Agrobacterium rosae]|uniref:hypothetical protein n=1 Tax=Agrobacterium rosae TaxID=1972867 RepID=UPI003BA3D015